MNINPNVWNTKVFLSEEKKEFEGLKVHCRTYQQWMILGSLNIITSAGTWKNWNTQNLRIYIRTYKL